MTATDLTPRQLTLAVELNAVLKQVIDVNETTYLAKHLGELKSNARAHDAGHAVAAFVKLYAHQLADARAVLRNECGRLRATDEDDLTAAAVRAHTVTTERLFEELKTRWQLKVTDRIIGVGTAEQHHDTRRVYQHALKQLEAQAVAMNGWAGQEVLQDLEALFTRVRFDRYQAVATASAKTTAWAAKATAWATVAIAGLAVATLIETWVLADKPSKAMPAVTASENAPKPVLAQPAASGTSAGAALLPHRPETESPHLDRPAAASTSPSTDR